MKNLLLFIILSSNSYLLWGQDIPLKDSMIYYTFEHKELNQKKCLKKYWIRLVAEPVSMQSVTKELIELCTNKNNKFSLNFPPLIWAFNLIPKIEYTNNNYTEVSCIDTVFSFDCVQNVDIQIPVKNSIINVLLPGKKDVSYQGIKACAQVFFTSNNEYKVVLKGFNYHVKYTEGRQYREELFPLEDLLFSKKSDFVYLFRDIDYLVRGADNAYNVALKRYIKTSELD
jgi:hypothetical protein